MTRAEYIETIIKIFRAKYKPSEVELEEVKLALEMMPDREVLLMPKQPFFPTDPQNPYERPVVVMCGAQMPETTWYGSNTTVTTTTKKIEQNPAWSEKNEAVLDALIRRLEGEDIYVSPHLAVECLKSLKERYTWKPSDEQMNALYNARCILKPNYNHADIASTLETLYNDLKKLKG